MGGGHATARDAGGGRSNNDALLEECDDQDYFERGIELAIEKDGLVVLPIDISDLFAVEVDFEADLERANQRTI